NSAYLAAFATPSLFYFANVVLHLVLGVALTVVASRYMLTRLGTHTSCAAAATGLYLTVAGTSGHARLLQAHIVSATLGSVLLIVWLVQLASGSRDRGARRAAMATTIVLLAATGLAFVQAQRSERGRRDAYRIVNPQVPPARMDGEGAGPSSPFFPSSANTNVNGIIPAEFFQTSQMCGRCHRDIYEQWNSSMHHFSSFNNQWYRKSIEYMQDTIGTKPSKWCAGCHDHAVFFNGRFDRPIKEQIDTPV